MPGASGSTLRVSNVNANWAAGDDGAAGVFELQVITEDGQGHTLVPAVDAVAGLLSMIAASPVLLWDPDNRTLIGANIVGDRLPLDWSGRDRAS